MKARLATRAVSVENVSFGFGIAFVAETSSFEVGPGVWNLTKYAVYSGGSSKRSKKNDPSFPP